MIVCAAFCWVQSSRSLNSVKFYFFLALCSWSMSEGDPAAPGGLRSIAIAIAPGETMGLHIWLGYPRFSAASSVLLWAS